MEIPVPSPPPADPAQPFAAGSPTPPPATLRRNLEDFALAELVRQHRGSFAPLWTIESWAKLLIWLALNSGCSGDTASLEAFAAALGPERSARLRQLFFSRDGEAVGLDLQADPAEAVALLRVPPGGRLPDPEGIAALLEQVGLAPRLVLDPGRWQERGGGLVIPFA
jgi:hypothetical protein